MAEGEPSAPDGPDGARQDDSREFRGCLWAFAGAATAIVEIVGLARIEFGIFQGPNSYGGGLALGATLLAAVFTGRRAFAVGFLLVVSLGLALVAALGGGRLVAF
jgi:hypothetical protein